MQLLSVKKSRRIYRPVSGMDFVLANHNNNHHHHQQQQQHHDDEDDGDNDHDHDDDDDDRLTVFSLHV